jgi:hypothetical protein
MCIRGLAGSHFNKQVVCTNRNEGKSEQTRLPDVQKLGEKLWTEQPIRGSRLEDCCWSRGG